MSGGANTGNGTDRHGIGGNRGPKFEADGDPGPDHDYVGAGPVAISDKVIPAGRERFYDAIRSQGPEKVRRRAVDMAKERARKDKQLSHLDFRVFDAIASWSKWKHRYCWQSMEMLAFASSQTPAHSNVARHVDRLVALGYVVDIHVPSATGGRHKRYLTVACTAADRSGRTLNDIASEARQHKIRGADDNHDEVEASDGASNPQPGNNGTALRHSDALPCNSGDAIRHPDVSIRSPDVSIRNPDALTLDTHVIDGKEEGGGARPSYPILDEHGRLVTRPAQQASARTPHGPPPAESDIQQQPVGSVDATSEPPLSPEVGAILRSWWPGLGDEDADKLLVAYLQTLDVDKRSARLESIVRSLEAERAAGKVREPGKLVERRIEQANTRSRIRKASVHGEGVGTVPFKSGETLGHVGFGGKVTGADAMDILAAVPGSDPDTVRRLIREVCGKWTGPNGKAKSTQHVVDEVTRLLRASNGASPAEQPGEAIRVGKPSKEDAAELAALGRRLGRASPSDTGNNL